MQEVLTNRLQDVFKNQERIPWRENKRKRNLRSRLKTCPANPDSEGTHYYLSACSEKSPTLSSLILWISVEEESIEAKQRIDIQAATPLHEPEKNISHDFIDLARRLEEHGYLENALDLIYDQVDNLFKSGDFSDCDKILDGTDTDDFSIDILLGLLTTTSWAKSKLPARENFFVRVEQTLRARGELEKGLLDGLEG